jgi:hypothetical protein
MAKLLPDLVRVRLVNVLRLASRQLEALGPLEGDAPEPIVCADAPSFERGTIRAVERCLARGFALSDIAVLTLRGRDDSRLLGRARLGPWTQRSPTGRVDDGGRAVWMDGALLMDAVRRFKGRTAPAVVLTECDLPRPRKESASGRRPDPDVATQVDLAGRTPGKTAPKGSGLRPDPDQPTPPPLHPNAVRSA